MTFGNYIYVLSGEENVEAAKKQLLAEIHNIIDALAETAPERFWIIKDAPRELIVNGMSEMLPGRLSVAWKIDIPQMGGEWPVKHK